MGAGGHRARRRHSMTGPAAPRRARLELLVRKPDADGQGFEVKEVGSAVAFVRLRPQRVDPDAFELAEVPSRLSGQPSFILKNRLTERYLLLSEPERFLWDQMDGQRSLQDLATAYVLRYGEFDFDIIPALIRKMIEAQERGESEVVLWGDGSPTREFLYVDDCAEGIVLASLRYDGDAPVNLGTGEEISIRDLAEVIGEATGYSGEIVWDRSKPNGQPRRKLDTTRAKELFGFEAKTPFREGIRRTVAWYREHAPAYAAR